MILSFDTILVQIEKKETIILFKMNGEVVGHLKSGPTKPGQTITLNGIKGQTEIKTVQ